MIVDHIGYAVKDLDKAIPVFKGIGYRFEERVEDHDRNLVILFGNNGNIRVELLQTLDANKVSPISNVLQKNGPTSYHICYKTKDIEEQIKQLKKTSLL